MNVFMAVIPRAYQRKKNTFGISSDRAAIGDDVLYLRIGIAAQFTFNYFRYFFRLVHLAVHFVIAGAA